MYKVLEEGSGFTEMLQMEIFLRAKNRRGNNMVFVPEHNTCKALAASFHWWVKKDHI